MIFRIDMDGETRVLVSHMPPSRRQKIKEALRAVAGDPAQGKPLQEDLAGLYSLRVGSLRIIYSVDATHRVVHVVTIGPRRTIYEELERELKSRK